MKERPILFSTPMVQAILEGRKTQTRRIVKLVKNIDNPKFGYTVFTPKGSISVRGINENGRYGESFMKCPYGVKGDVLWVRETFLDGDDYCCSPHHEDETLPRFVYKADVPQENWEELIWKPSIFMPKEACRIRLEITGMRVERLQDISEDDAITEGIEDLTYGEKLSFRDYKNDKHPLTAGASYKSLWEKINGEGSWDLNPWVWVVNFKRK